jgi:hypothetical protein
VPKPQYVYRDKWHIGDLLMWDNCAVQHLASLITRYRCGVSWNGQPSKDRFLTALDTTTDVVLAAHSQALDAR